MFVLRRRTPDFVALYTYESPEAGDLTFDEGDVVMVTEREGEWWRGCIGDRAGVFPSNYVRPVEPEVESSTSTHSYKYPPSTGLNLFNGMVHLK